MKSTYDHCALHSLSHDKLKQSNEIFNGLLHNYRVFTRENLAVANAIVVRDVQSNLNFCFLWYQKVHW